MSRTSGNAHVIATRQQDLAISYLDLGALAIAREKFDEGPQDYDRAIRLLTEIAEGDTTSRSIMIDLAIAYDSRGDLARIIGDTDHEVQSYTKSMEIRTTLIDEYPDDAVVCQGLAVSQERLAEIAVQQGDMLTL
jgi:tetratricopeptide (TPR) repeat protein